MLPCPDFGEYYIHLINASIFRYFFFAFFFKTSNVDANIGKTQVGILIVGKKGLDQKTFKV